MASDPEGQRIKAVAQAQQYIAEGDSVKVDIFGEILRPSQPRHPDEPDRTARNGSASTQADACISERGSDGEWVGFSDR